MSIFHSKIVPSISYSGWKATGTRATDIVYDLATNPLQIKTNSTLGSEDEIRAIFYSEDGRVASGVRVRFTDPPEYWIGYCASEWVAFNPPDPVGTDRVWTIIETETSVIIWCDGVEVVNFEFSSSNSSSCEIRWAEDSVNLRFWPDDTASNEYRIYARNLPGTVYRQHFSLFYRQHFSLFSPQ